MTTKADLERFRKLQELGCIACHMLGHFSVPEIHHLKSGNKRKGHQDTIPLCPAHHRGVEHDPELHGPSLALAPRSFHAAFGSDDYLLARVDMMLKGDWHDHIF